MALEDWRALARHPAALWQTCYDRFVRWSRNGTWPRLLKAMQAAAEASGRIDWDGATLDATVVAVAGQLRQHQVAPTA